MTSSGKIETYTRHWFDGLHD